MEITVFHNTMNRTTIFVTNDLLSHTDDGGQMILSPWTGDKADFLIS